MDRLSKLRKWANRDDGRLYRVGNGPIGLTTAIGALSLIVALVLWQLHTEIGLSSMWTAGAAVLGIGLLGLSVWRGSGA